MQEGDPSLESRDILISFLRDSNFVELLAQQLANNAIQAYGHNKSVQEIINAYTGVGDHGSLTAIRDRLRIIVTDLLKERESTK